MTSTSPSTCLAINLTEDQIDDILFCARTNEHQDLLAFLKDLIYQLQLSKDTHTDQQIMAQIISQARTDTGNTAWHYASANAHLETLETLHSFISSGAPSTSHSTDPVPDSLIQIRAPMLTPNSSGNTPLHWASLNGHLSIVSKLISWIDDLPPSITSIIKSQHDSIHKEAKARRKSEAEKAARENGEEISKEDEEDEEERQRREKEESDLRPLWDVPNKSGRGPMSEAQLGGHEELVKWLLERMVLGGRQGTSAERVENEKDTPVSQDGKASTSENQKKQTSDLHERVEQVKLS